MEGGLKGNSAGNISLPWYSPPDNNSKILEEEKKRERHRERERAERERWLLLVGTVFRGREIACLAAALGPLACLAAALGPLT